MRVYKRSKAQRRIHKGKNKIGRTVSEGAHDAVAGGDHHHVGGELDDLHVDHLPVAAAAQALHDEEDEAGEGHREGEPLARRVKLHPVRK